MEFSFHFRGCGASEVLLYPWSIWVVFCCGLVCPIFGLFVLKLIQTKISQLRQVMAMRTTPPARTPFNSYINSTKFPEKERNTWQPHRIFNSISKSQTSRTTTAWNSGCLCLELQLPPPGTPAASAWNSGSGCFCLELRCQVWQGHCCFVIKLSQCNMGMAMGSFTRPRIWICPSCSVHCSDRLLFLPHLAWAQSEEKKLRNHQCQDDLLYMKILGRCVQT